MWSHQNLKSKLHHGFCRISLSSPDWIVAKFTPLNHELRRLVLPSQASPEGAVDDFSEIQSLDDSIMSLVLSDC